MGRFWIISSHLSSHESVVLVPSASTPLALALHCVHSPLGLDEEIAYFQHAGRGVLRSAPVSPSSPPVRLVGSLVWMVVVVTVVAGVVGLIFLVFGVWSVLVLTVLTVLVLIILVVIWVVAQVMRWNVIDILGLGS